MSDRKAMGMTVGSPSALAGQLAVPARTTAASSWHASARMVVCASIVLTLATAASIATSASVTLTKSTVSGLPLSTACACARTRVRVG